MTRTSHLLPTMAGIRSSYTPYEISHAFDTNGASFDENGSLEGIGGQRATNAAFKEKNAEGYRPV